MRTGDILLRLHLFANCGFRGSHRKGNLAVQQTAYRERLRLHGCFDFDYLRAETRHSTADSTAAAVGRVKGLPAEAVDVVVVPVADAAPEVAVVVVTVAVVCIVRCCGGDVVAVGRGRLDVPFKDCENAALHFSSEAETKSPAAADYI